MKKNNKGFTLIELLAVVAILAIVFALAYNQIANRTSKSKMNTLKVNADRYVKAVNDMATMSIKEDVDYEEGTYAVTDLQSTGKIKTTGTLPTGGYVVIENYEVIDACLIYENKYSVEFENAVAKNVVEELVCLTDSDLTEEFAYTGHEEVYTVHKTGKYKLETWGAQGGAFTISSTDFTSGYGAYSTGEIYLHKGDKLYINVGGVGEYCTTDSSSTACTSPASYNGGASCTTLTGYSTNLGLYGCGSGGGATSVATKTGVLSSLENDKDKVIIVASGGGGAQSANAPYNKGNGGHGGGFYGVPNVSTGNDNNTVPAASQSGGNAFGQGINSGGGGYYGGSGYLGGGTGGSGYIANPNLTNKVMYCYNCFEAIDSAAKTMSTTCAENNPTSNCAKKGAGYAKISYVGKDAPSFDDVQVAYDYNTFYYTFNSANAYIDTGFNVDFSKDFILQAVVNIPTSGKRYLIFGNYESSNELNIEITTANKVRVYSKGEKSLSSETIPLNKDINIIFQYKASDRSYRIDAVSSSGTITNTGTISISSTSGRNIRMNTDYRTGTFTAFTVNSARYISNYTSGSLITNLPTPVTKSGTAFSGWSTTPGGSVDVSGATVVPNGSTSFYAIW